MSGGTAGAERRRRAAARGQTHLWAVQRVTAMLLGIAVVVHLATILFAVRGGLTAAEILGRTRGNGAWLAFYTVFALAAGLHGAIGLRNIAAETIGLRGRGADLAWLAIGLVTAGFGIRAAYGLFA
ncbi:succinate dehydrogenase [Roseomonas eburnea]|uniref:Succinate dehydrogenase n=1 Tax=Neoroseomonas eburnea TaxID=1346889 RepID=A0A9X9XAE8_9PROT|nr:succinate dehydrogenase [Neoroseomonas eburnea]MBR0680684.1 succinate dehydrogenase [Neoroseomonas eburnea]